MQEEFSRTVLLIGEEGLDKLSRVTVAVFGIGGVGAFAVEALARAGIGKLVLVDPDRVERSNINRQLHATQSTIGCPKVLAMKERVANIIPSVQVEIKMQRYALETASTLLRSDYSYVLDAMDDVLAKVDLIMRARQLGVPIISSMGAGNRLSAAHFRVADISGTRGCPLARKVRCNLRDVGITSGVKVVFSPEPALKPTYRARELGSRRHVPGSISFVPSVVGLLMAGECIRDLLSTER